MLRPLGPAARACAPGRWGPGGQLPPRHPPTPPGQMGAGAGTKEAAGSGQPMPSAGMVWHCLARTDPSRGSATLYQGWRGSRAPQAEQAVVRQEAFRCSAPGWNPHGELLELKQQSSLLNVGENASLFPAGSCPRSLGRCNCWVRWLCFVCFCGFCFCWGGGLSMSKVGKTGVLWSLQICFPFKTRH